MDSRVVDKKAFAALPLKGKALVVGLGKTGLSCARFLRRKGFEVAVTDSRPLPPGLNELTEQLPDLPMFLGGFDPSAFAAADVLVVSPGVSLAEPLVNAAIRVGKTVVGDIELFARYVDAPVAAITGSNGKSTVTTLLGEMAHQAGLRVMVGGNLGEPALDLLDKNAELYVLELSSFQLDTLVSLQPKVAVVLNISEDHMDRYDDLQAYIDSKASIYVQAQNRIINADDPRVLSMVNAGDHVRRFTLGVPGTGDYGLRHWQGQRYLCRGEERLMSVDEVVIPGSHNLANALAAWAMADVLGIDDQAKRHVLRNFKGLPHRTQLVAEKNGIRWYNDSKGTNVGATVAALNGLVDETTSARAVLIAGGDCKGADFTDLGPVAARTCRAVVLIGRDGPRIEPVLKKAGVATVRGESMAQAVELAATLAEPGDCVLLSPACASFDMFQNYLQRGDIFAASVEAFLQ